LNSVGLLPAASHALRLVRVARTLRRQPSARAAPASAARARALAVAGRLVSSRQRRRRAGRRGSLAARRLAAANHRALLRLPPAARARAGLGFAVPHI